MTDNTMCLTCEMRRRSRDKKRRIILSFVGAVAAWAIYLLGILAGANHA